MKKFNLLVLSFVLTVMCGCRSYYQETGVSATAGDVSAPLEVSDSSDIINVRALFSMTGAKVWASRGNAIYMRYKCSSTNEYLYIVDTRMDQESEMIVVPTNASPSVISMVEHLISKVK